MSKVAKKIITYNGTEEEAGACRKIAGQFYKIGDLTKENSGQCYLYEDTYYRETSTKLQWDHELERYNHVDNMVKGYTLNGLKYFTYNRSKNYHASEGLFVIDNTPTILKVNNLYWDFARGVYVPHQPGISKPAVLPRKPTYKTLSSEIYSLNEYNTTEIQQDFNKYVKTANLFDKFLHNYTYGLEIETDGGYFPENLFYKLGCVPLKDGSIMGTEITTLLYPPNINLMEELFNNTSQFCTATHNNSLHVNLSGFKNSPKFRVAMYLLYYRLQQEILAFTPLYKRDLQYFTDKRGGPKDHCKPMESLNIVHRYKKDTLDVEVKKADEIIFKFLNEGVYDDTYNIETRRHVRQGNAKWDHQNRYYALNLMPMYFGNVANSRIEFRLHSGTVNKYKSLIWIFICAAITKFVENNTDRILIGTDKITLDDVLYETIIREDNDEERFLLDYITTYINQRREKNTSYIMNHNGSIYGDEFSRDNSFVFEIQGKLSPFNYEFSRTVKEISTKRKPSKKGA